MKVRNATFKELLDYAATRIVLKETKSEFDPLNFAVEGALKNRSNFSSNHVLSSVLFTDRTGISVGMIQTGPYSEVTPDVDFDPILVIFELEPEETFA